MERNKSKIILSRIMFIVLAAVAVVATLVIASYIKNAGKVENFFAPAESINPVVDEKFDGSVKEDVRFQVGNTEYPVYVRAKIIITWKDKDGIIFYNPVEDRYYELSLNLSDIGWVDGGDGYYYYQTPVTSGNKTDILLERCVQKEDSPFDGYTLSVEFLVQTVQAVGYTDEDNPNDVIPAYKDAWRLSLNLDEKYY